MNALLPPAAVVAVLCGACSTAVQAPPATPMPIRVVGGHCMDKTTESGADEVYLLVWARHSSGKVFTQRLPSDHPNQSSGHWDMNDSGNKTNNSNGDSRCISPVTYFANTLEPGESWDVQFTWMEEDRGMNGTDEFTKAASKGAIATGDPYAVAGGTLLGILVDLGLFPKIDSDDWYGTTQVHLSNNGGQLGVQYSNGERMMGGWPKHPGNNPVALEARMSGDGSNFVVTYSSITP